MTGKVTIITVVRNAEQYIDRTIQSVLAQGYSNIEYLVIDGASTDQTLARIKKYRSLISKIVSEPDAGISDAWNKGLALASGEFVGLLNAGDEYMPDSVSNAVEVLRAGADLVYGDTELVDDAGRVLRFNRGRFGMWYYSAGFGFYHPSCFAKHSLYQSVGGFNLRLKYAMDTDWIARAKYSGARIEHAPIKARMVDGGVSVQSRFLAYGEHLQALQNCGASPAVIYGSMVMTGLRGLVRAVIPARRP